MGPTPTVTLSRDLGRVASPGFPALRHYELGTDATTLDRVAVAFTELALAI